MKCLNGKITVLSGLLVLSLLLNIILLTHPGTPETAAESAAAEQDASGPAVEVEAKKPEPLVLEKSAFYEWSSLISLRFSRTLQSAPAKVEISPRVEDLSYQMQMNELHLRGSFAPETVYTVTVRAGLAAEDGGKLARDAVSVIRTPKLSPDIEFLTSGPYLPLHGSRVLAAKFRNIGKIRFTLT